MIVSSLFLYRLLLCLFLVVDYLIDVFIFELQCLLDFGFVVQTGKNHVSFSIRGGSTVVMGNEVTLIKNSSAHRLSIASLNKAVVRNLVRTFPEIEEAKIFLQDFRIFFISQRIGFISSPTCGVLLESKLHLFPKKESFSVIEVWLPVPYDAAAG